MMKPTRRLFWLADRSMGMERLLRWSRRSSRVPPVERREKCPCPCRGGPPTSIDRLYGRRPLYNVCPDSRLHSELASLWSFLCLGEGINKARTKLMGVHISIESDRENFRGETSPMKLSLPDPSQSWSIESILPRSMNAVRCREWPALPTDYWKELKSRHGPFMGRGGGVLKHCS